MMISSLILNQYNLSTVLGRYLQAIRATVQKIIVYTIIRSYGAQKPRKERVVIHIQSQEPAGTGIALEKSAEHPCPLGKNSSTWILPRKTDLFSHSKESIAGVREFQEKQTLLKITRVQPCFALFPCLVLSIR